VLPIDSCIAAVGVAAVGVAAVGVAAVGVATSRDARRQSTIERLTRLRAQIGVGLHSADDVRVPIWLSMLLVVIYMTRLAGPSAAQSAAARRHLHDASRGSVCYTVCCCSSSPA